MPDDQGNETWQDWWQRNHVPTGWLDKIDQRVVARMKHRSLGKSDGRVEFVDTDISPDAQEIVAVGSILNGD